MRIALYGFMGAGKTVLGQALAQRLAYDFIDLDVEIQRFTNKSISEIFASEGEIGFRRIEHQVLKDFIKENKNNVVLSLGGGTILRPTNRQLLDLRQFYKIYLNVDIAVLIARLIKDKADRPLIKDLSNEALPDYIKALFESRRLVYEQYADLKVAIAHDNFEGTLQKIYSYLNMN